MACSSYAQVPSTAEPFVPRALALQPLENKMRDGNETTNQPVQDPGSDLDRLADLCSVGAVPVPDDLSERETKRLFLLIADRRRIRLIDFIARSIADDFCNEQINGGAKNAQKNIRSDETILVRDLREDVG